MDAQRGIGGAPIPQSPGLDARHRGREVPAALGASSDRASR